MQLAEPKALPCVLLIETSIGSDTDQITLMRLDWRWGTVISNRILRADIEGA